MMKIETKTTLPLNRCSNGANSDTLVTRTRSFAAAQNK
jgi:hypothetical protein